MDALEREMEELVVAGRRVESALSGGLKLFDLFARFDTRSTGYVQQHELENVLRFVGLGAREQQAFERRFCSVFADRRCQYSDVARFVELVDDKKLAAMMRRVATRRTLQAAEDAFAQVDRRRSGFVTVRAFRGICAKFFQVREMETQLFVSRFAHPRDAERINYADFLNALPSTKDDRQHAQQSDFFPKRSNDRRRNPRNVEEHDDEHLWRRNPRRRNVEEEVDDQHLWRSGTKHEQEHDDASLLVDHRKKRIGDPEIFPPNILPSTRRLTVHNRKQSWTCVVCFYSENAALSKECEICDAANASAADADLYIECPNCAFPNPENSNNVCEICQTELCSKKAAEILRASSRNPERPQKQTHDGWSTACFEDGDDDFVAVSKKKHHHRRRDSPTPSPRRGSSRGGPSSYDW